MAETGNTNLSTLLLLGVLIFLIYCLMKQPATNATQETANQETSNNRIKVNSKQDSDQVEDDQENFEDISDGELSDSASEARSESSSVKNVRDFTMKSPRPPALSGDVVNKLVSGSDGASNLNSTLLGTGKSVFNFEPNDDNTFTGASLQNAFERPVSESVDTDVVDLNKNNVTSYSASDYLPKEVNDDWFNTDFSQAKYKMNDDKLINTDKYIIGINTVGQSLKNASYDIRGSVNVPKYTVSPWNNSTIEPDYNIKPLC
jgi:hypothetical protein